MSASAQVEFAHAHPRKEHTQTRFRISCFQDFRTDTSISSNDPPPCRDGIRPHARITGISIMGIKGVD
jgi:hypothetical protein